MPLKQPPPSPRIAAAVPRRAPLIRRLAVLGLLGLMPVVTGSAAVPPAELAAGVPLTDPAQDPAWRELLARLAPRKSRQSTFEERRYFPFRREPVRLRGEIRLVPSVGLSLNYLVPEQRILIVDDQGLLMRDAAGEDRAPPADSRMRAATSALVRVLRFDWEGLKKDFTVQGRRNGDAWTLWFTPLDATFARLLGTLSVSGDQSQLRSIRMVKSPSQRIEIDILETVVDASFSTDALRQYFRRPADPVGAGVSAAPEAPR